jgi:hypothetical protein
VVVERLVSLKDSNEHFGLGIIVALHKDKVIRYREVIVRRFLVQRFQSMSGGAEEHVNHENGELQ